MRKRNSNPYTIPMIEVTTNLDWDELHKFNDDFITRYSDILSAGVDMRNVFERELSCHETGIKFFEIGKEYSLNERYSIMITGQMEEHSFAVCVNDNKFNDEYVEECEIFHDDKTEYIMVNVGGKRIQVKPI